MFVSCVSLFKLCKCLQLKYTMFQNTSTFIVFLSFIYPFGEECDFLFLFSTYLIISVGKRGWLRESIVNYICMYFNVTDVLFPIHPDSNYNNISCREIKSFISRKTAASTTYTLTSFLSVGMLAH